MILDLSIPFDRKRAAERLEYLISKQKRIEIKEKRKIRSLSQNNYLHLILTWYAYEYGETMSYIKEEIFKKQINPEIFKTEFVNEKTGEIRDSWRSTSELNTLELTTAIDRFRNYASKEAGIYLPEPRDLASINLIEQELSKHQSQQYL